MPNPFDADTIQPDDNNEVTVTLEDLVGEGRKYKDPNELAKAYNHADAYINSLKAKDAEKEAELKVLRDLVNARSDKTSNPNDQQQQQPRQEPPVVDAPQTPQVDLNELVRKELDSARAEERRAANVNKAAEVASAHFGNAAKAQEAIRRRAEELGVGVEWLQNSAAQSPNAFFATMGINPAARPTNTPGYNPDVNVNGGRGSKRNMSYYENIRKQDVKLYNSAEIRKQMMEDARELGSEFFSN